MGMSKKRLLFFINTLSGGGAEKVLIDTVNNMDKQKFDITLQTIIDYGIHKEKLNKDVNYKSIIKTKNPFIQKVLSYLINFVIPPQITYNLFIKSNYDYEIAYLEGIPTKILSYSNNKKSQKYSWVHIDLYNNFAGHEKIFKDFNNYIKCYQRYNKIICVSNGVKEGFIKRFNIEKNVDVVYNIYNDKKIKKLSTERQQEIPDDNTFKIITSGRLCEQKGYERLLEIHNQLISEGYKYHLYILGEGKKRPVLEKYIKDNKLEDSVTLLGFQVNPYKYINACDLFVCSSYAEGFSTVVVESVILGIPVVSTDVSGAKEILGNSEYGLVVDNDKESLYNGLVSILSDNNVYNYYIKKVKELSGDFDLEKAIKTMENLF